MTQPTWQSDDGSIRLHNADCREAMRDMEPDSIDSIVTDPPYGLSFMGKGWDHGIPGVEFWIEALRVAKPGAHLLAFGGTRTFHRLICAIEDAGWEIRDCIMWVYGSGFPKSLDVSKAIDKAAGEAREDAIAGGHKGMHGSEDRFSEGHRELKRAVKPQVGMGALTRGTPVTDSAKQWQGWGTALKPSWEPIIVARKPIVGTVAANTLQFGTGGINVDGCRVETSEQLQGSTVRNDIRGGNFANGHSPNPGDIPQYEQNNLGRWPANLIHDGSEEVIACFPDAPGQQADISFSAPSARTKNAFGAMNRDGEATAEKRYTNEGGTNFAAMPGQRRFDSGSAARFFYCAKASREDRNEGLGDMPEKPLLWSSGTQNPGSFQATGTNRASQNHHPTVKPTALMRYLCRLVTPPGGNVFDLFMGSGSTGKAALLEGFRFVGCDFDTEHGYFEIAKGRIVEAKRIAEIERARPKQLDLFGATA